MDKCMTLSLSRNDVYMHYSVDLRIMLNLGLVLCVHVYVKFM